MVFIKGFEFNLRELAEVRVI